MSDLVTLPRVEVIKALTRFERFLFEAHLLRLKSACRRSRFGNEVSDQFIREYVARVDFDNTVILGFFDGDHVRGVAEVRAFSATWDTQAEVAFSVEGDWRHRGIGTHLAKRAIELSSQYGIEKAFVVCDRANTPMRRIADKFTASVSFEGSDCIAQIAVQKSFSDALAA